MSEAWELYNRGHYVFSLDEAIEHAREAAECLARRAAGGEEMCEKRAIEHYALYRWLVELQERRANDELPPDYWAVIATRGRRQKKNEKQGV